MQIDEKVFVGKDITYVAIFRRNDERMVYNLAYLDGESGVVYAKRFHVVGVTRDKEYPSTKGTKSSRVLYFSANPNGEAEKVSVQLTPGTKAKIKVFDYDFSNLDIKNRSAQGNILTKYAVRKITFKEAGFSTLGSISIFHDDVVGKLNTDGRGTLLGNFKEDDLIINILKDGSYELTDFQLTNRYEPSTSVLLAKFDPEMVISAVYYDGEAKVYYAKRFKIETTTVHKKFAFIAVSKGSFLATASMDSPLNLVVNTLINKEKKAITLPLEDVVEIRGWKAQGSKLNFLGITSVELGHAEDKAEAKANTDTDTDASTDVLPDSHAQ